jgi:hypothetical protein
VYAFLNIHMHAACPTQHTLLDFIIFDKESKLRSP